MTPAWIAASLLTVLLVTPRAAGQTSTADTRPQQALEALERHWLAVEDDPSALETILADDFIHVLPMGFVTKREQIDFMRSHPAPKDGTAKRFENLRVRVYGTAGIATGAVIATRPDGTTQKTLFTDVFAFRDGRWQAVNAQELPAAGDVKR
jgi:hypothetical protein